MLFGSAWIDVAGTAGPVMIAVIAAWLVVLAGVIERGFYALDRARRRPAREARDMALRGRVDDAERILDAEREEARRGLERIDQTSQLATSIGLFGTVLGIAQGFLGRGGSSAPGESLSALAGGLSTALFTTLGGLVVFLFGQGCLLLYREWLSGCERRATLGVDEAVRA